MNSERKRGQTLFLLRGRRRIVGPFGGLPLWLVPTFPERPVPNRAPARPRRPSSDTLCDFDRWSSLSAALRFGRSSLKASVVADGLLLPSAKGADIANSALGVALDRDRYLTALLDLLTLWRPFAFVRLVVEVPRRSCRPSTAPLERCDAMCCAVTSLLSVLWPHRQGFFAHFTVRTKASPADVGPQYTFWRS